MTAPFPHRYTSTVTRIVPGQAEIEAPPRPPIVGGPPPEFDGHPHLWSPEHLLLSALGLCLFTTFEVLAQRDRLDVVCWRETVTGTLEKTSIGLRFTSFQIEVQVEVADGQLERTRRLLDRAHQLCIISNALNIPVAVVPRITTAAELAASA
jgi:organic hydroperoxide reductase OsmC/OhrA